MQKRGPWRGCRSKPPGLALPCPLAITAPCSLYIAVASSCYLQEFPDRCTEVLLQSMLEMAALAFEAANGATAGGQADRMPERVHMQLIFDAGIDNRTRLDYEDNAGRLDATAVVQCRRHTPTGRGGADVADGENARGSHCDTHPLCDHNSALLPTRAFHPSRAVPKACGAAQRRRLLSPALPSDSRHRHCNELCQQRAAQRHGCLHQRARCRRLPGPPNPPSGHPPRHLRTAGTFAA